MAHQVEVWYGICSYLVNNDILMVNGKYILIRNNKKY